jgi:hypothetical protein
VILNPEVLQLPKHAKGEVSPDQISPDGNQPNQVLNQQVQPRNAQNNVEGNLQQNQQTSLQQKDPNKGVQHNVPPQPTEQPVVGQGIVAGDYGGGQGQNPNEEQKPALVKQEEEKEAQQVTEKGNVATKAAISRKATRAPTQLTQTGGLSQVKPDEKMDTQLDPPGGKQMKEGQDIEQGQMPFHNLLI